MRPRFAEPEFQAPAAPTLSQVLLKMAAATVVAAGAVWAGLQIVGLFQ